MKLQIPQEIILCVFKMDRDTRDLRAALQQENNELLRNGYDDLLNGVLKLVGKLQTGEELKWLCEVYILLNLGFYLWIYLLFILHQTI